MKKLTIVIILFVFLTCISGCSRANEKTNWNMQSIQGSGGAVIYCSNENKDNYLNATIKNIVCTLENSSITITDKDTGEEWIGKCKIIEESPQINTTIYEVKFDNNQKGYIGKSITKYADNTQENTLIISCGEYSLNFTENTNETN
ncbi:hypothetical protein [Paraclostridium bifermentans]|uniref:hypothetical protein n=1 Tax=Paraclostridium bifermentans TaxID=1490 RepID=UPI00359C9444